MMAKKTLRAGLIGLGVMGRHPARNLRALEGVEPVAIADPGGDPYGVAEEREVLSGARARGGAGSAYAAAAAPTPFHHDVALTFAQAGIHCLVEQPLALDIGEAAEIARTFEERPLLGAVGYVERYNP